MIGQVIQTDRLVLRRWKDSDREPFYQLNSDPRVMEFYPKCLTREESDALIRRIDGHFERHNFGLYAVELREEPGFIGYIGLAHVEFQTSFTPCAEIGWRLAAAHWGKGLATEGARAAARYGFESLGLDEIVSFTVPANLRSRRVMDKIGMAYSGEFDHPNLPEDHPLRRHVLYRLSEKTAPWRRTPP